MIDRLTGTLAVCDLTGVVVDVHGVGYALTIPMSTYDQLPTADHDVQLFTHLHVREDLLELFGFATLDERRLFRLLITVNGIGCRLALNVLSCMSVETFCRAVAESDMKSLTRVNGLGKRSAERLIVELRERVADLHPEATLGAVHEGQALPGGAQDAMTALETLGFKPDVARKAVMTICAELPEAEQSAENLIRTALQKLNS